MMNCPVTNSTRIILSMASLIMECMKSGLLDVNRTCLVSVMKTWCPLLSTAMFICSTKLWSCCCCQDIEFFVLSSRTVVFHLLPMFSVTSKCAGSHSYKCYALHICGNIPGDGAWYHTFSI